MSRLTRRDLLRSSAIGATALTGVPALASCGSDADAAGDSTGNITVWSWTTPSKALQALVPDFEKANPGITVEVQDVGNPAIWDKITVGMAAGGQGLADILHIGIDYLPGYAEKFPDGLANLSELGADQFESEYVSGLWPSVVFDGKARALPWDVSPSGFFYRTDLFENVGVDPSTFETWDDVIAAGIKLKKKSSESFVIGLDKSASSSPDMDFFQSLLQLQGVFYFNEQGDITLGSEEAVRAMSIIKELNDQDLIGDASGEQGSRRLISGNHIAVFPYPPWAAEHLASTYPEQSGKWQLSQPPAVTSGGSRAAIVGASFLTISETSEKKAAAWNFLQYALTRPESVNTGFEIGSLLPGLESAYDDEAYEKEWEFFDDQVIMKTFIDELTGGDATASNYSGDYSRALKLASNAQVQVLIKNADPRTALQAAAQQLAEQTGRTIA